MPMEFLLSLAQGDLPRTIEDIAEIDKLRVLTAAGLVEAELPDVQSGAQRAEVSVITPEGRAALRKSFPGVDLARRRAAVSS